MNSSNILLVLLMLLSTCTDGKRLCLFNCTAFGYVGVPLYVPLSCQQRTKADACGVDVKFSYHDQRYTVEFKTSFVTNYYRSIYILPSNYLSYTAIYACSDHDNCAIDFTTKKVLDLSNRMFNVGSVTNQLATLLLEQRQPSDPALCCYDSEQCVSGLCKVDIDTKTNKVNERTCVRDGTVRVHVFDGGSLPSLSVECNRTRCNSPENVNAVKEILFRHNLTDANGRINGGRKECVSAVFFVSTLFFLGLCVTSFSFEDN